MSIDVKASDSLYLEKDANGYVHIKLYQNSNGINVTELTLAPERTGLPVINRIIVFLKPKYIELLKKQGIIDEYIESKEGIWCGFLNINIYLELENSPKKIYTRKVLC